MPIHQLLVKYGVSVVFHGHDHIYAKQDLDGIVYQLVPQPGAPRDHVGSAKVYGYEQGKILGSSGHMRVTVSDDRAVVDLIRSYLPTDEKGKGLNGENLFSYTLYAK